MAKTRRGRSAAFMKALRKKYRLGEYAGSKARPGGRAARRRKPRKPSRADTYTRHLEQTRKPGETTKDAFLRELDSGEYFQW